MIDFEDIDARLDGIGKNRAWLAEITGRSPGAIRTALAPNAPAVRRTPLLQRALSDAIEREEESQRSADAISSDDLTEKLEELNRQVAELRKEPGLTLRPSPNQFEEWEAAALAENLTLTKWAMKAVDEALSGYQQSKIVPLPTVKPHIVVAAGSPLNGEIENWDGGDDTVIVRVSGRSMEPLFHDDQIIKMTHRRAARSEFMKKGLIYIVSYDGGYTLKRYNTRLATPEEIGEGVSYVSKVDGKTKVHVLESLNEEFPEIVVKDAANWIAWIDPKKL